MFNYIKGIVTEKYENTITIENNSGIGFEVYCSSYAIWGLEIGEVIKMFTYFQSGENGVALFGFSKKEEKALFLKLITVSGIGPKSAMGILSSESIERIAFFIASADVRALSKLKGIGKKTAERIIVELKDKVDGGNNSLPLVTAVQKPLSEDAITGLLALGFTSKEAEESVQRAIDEGATKLEDIISLAIKRSYNG